MKICVFILKTESVEKSTYRLPLLVLLCRKFDMSPFPFPNLKIIFIIFFPFRLTSARNLTAQQINRALEDIPFDSDKCGLSDNSDMYVNWLPAREGTATTTSLPLWWCGSYSGSWRRCCGRRLSWSGEVRGSHPIGRTCTASAAKEAPFNQGQGVGVAKEEFVIKAPACKLCEA